MSCTTDGGIEIENQEKAKGKTLQIFLLLDSNKSLKEEIKSDISNVLCYLLKSQTKL